MSEKTCEFRELRSTDLFPMFKIMNKIGFRKFKDCFKSPEIASMAKSANADSEVVENIGMSVLFDVVGIVIENIPACEDDIYSLLASVSNLDKKEVQEMGMSEFIEMIVDFIKKPEFKDFFKVVSRLFKSEI